MKIYQFKESRVLSRFRLRIQIPESREHDSFNCAGITGCLWSFTRSIGGKVVCTSSSMGQIFFYFLVTISGFNFFLFCVLLYNDSRDGECQRVQFFQQIDYLSSFVASYIYHTDIMLLQVAEKIFPSNWGEELFSFIFFHFPPIVWWVIGRKSPNCTAGFFVFLVFFLFAHTRKMASEHVEYTSFLCLYTNIHIQVRIRTFQLPCSFYAAELMLLLATDSNVIWVWSLPAYDFIFANADFSEVCLYIL